MPNNQAPENQASDNQQQWLELLFDTTADNADLLSDLLSEAGALAVTLKDLGDEPIYEPALGTEPLWQDTCVIGLFEADTDASDILHHIQTALQQSSPPQCHIKRLHNQDWERVWLDHFKPMKFGDRLWICPSAYTPPEPEAINLLLDPGLAFGTGTHATTALCLEWLDKHPLTGQTVIDYGCGSGVLAIAAILLGAQSVHAVDIDQQALTATEDNALRNGINNQVISLHTPADLPDIKADCLLANILANPLKELAETFASLLKPGGAIVLSGILEEQSTDVQQAFKPWFDLNYKQTRDGWVCLAGTLKPQTP